MAIVYAVSAGVWSAPARWNTGALPAPGDDVRSNNFVVTIDQDINVASLSNAAGGSAVAGGSFSITTNRTIQANVVAGATTCVSITGGAVVSWTGNVTGGSGTSTHGIAVTSSTLNFTGNATGGSGGTTASGIAVSTASTLNMTGDALGGLGGQTSAGVYIVTNTSVATITGNVYGSANAVGVYQIATSNFTLNGNSTGGSASSIYGIYVNGTGANCTVNGNVIGGTGSASDGVRNLLAGTVTITGYAQGGVGAGARNEVGGTIRVVLAKGSDTNTTAGLQGILSTGTTTYERAEDGITGTEPTFGFCKMKPAALNTIKAMMEDGTFKTLVVTDQVANGQPAIADVRLGTIYDFGNKTGTCAVPLPAQVVSGVAVDNTVGTAVLTIAQIITELNNAITAINTNTDTEIAAAVTSINTNTDTEVAAAITAISGAAISAQDVWDVPTANLTTAGSIGERAKNQATVQTTGDQIANLM